MPQYIIDADHNFQNLIDMNNLTRMFPNPNYPWGRGHNHHPLLEIRDFSGTKPPLDLRPVCKFEFVCCCPAEKKHRALYLSQFNHGGQTKFKTTL